MLNAASDGVEAAADTADDGDDYIEGGGGNDTILGGLGQDDIIGGSSDLFGLTTRAMRPDGVDTIYGGNGDAVGRNDAGDVSDDGHARDSDYILGDNGRIFRIVGTHGTDSGDFLSFAYDTYGTEDTDRVKVRFHWFLDYTPYGGAGYWSTEAPVHPSAPEWVDGAETNVGGGDFIHGEAGDDFIHGMTGSDALFGDGQDDDLYGEEGYDWISGGTGDDGILGDDGLLLTSRNGTTEPLYGITASTESIISTPGDLQLATINVTGELAKAADLEPFWIGHNDVIYGGLGNDFIHAGVGDDAVSGAEALPFYYVNDPLSLLALYYEPGNVLQYDFRTGSGEFAYYDEYDPWRRIHLRDVPVTGSFLLDGSGNRIEFLLNFEARLDPADPAVAIDDGKDTIFGDGGNDWIVGGTGHDRMFGGWGDDLLQADDDLDSTFGSGDDDANNTPDARTSAPTFADIAYGGAGRDIMIANTGADRLIGWVGEFNSYIVPFSPYGAFTISRAPSPHIYEYLYALSAASGIDLTRGGDVIRNGEPYGELGLVTQKDEDWKAQTGAPADPQPGSVSGPRDVLRYEDFGDGVSALFAVEAGDWEVINGRYQSTAQVGSDAVSVFYVDYLVPNYFEIVATMSADKPTGGFDANAYVIFDYVSPTDFKFAGIDVKLDKIQIGHRTADGWIVDVQSGLKLEANRNYELTVVINGTEVTLWIDGASSLTYLFDSTLNDAADPDSGYIDPLGDGYLGLGSIESVIGTTGFRVQVPT
ncbi:MAG: hypothetical protein U9R51_07290, partial [Actinomycetota bacterium]|nr:hypothetical protein [Actinomycetota bacterium]